jgi:MtfA peptidase
MAGKGNSNFDYLIHLIKQEVKSNSNRVAKATWVVGNLLFCCPMPADSLYIINQAGDTLLRMLGPRAAEQAHALEDQVDTKWAPVFVFSLMAVVFLVPVLIKWGYQTWRKTTVDRTYTSKQALYDSLLQQYIPYYRRLTAAQKERFLKRTLTFMALKRFEYVQMEAEEQMPLLISAAAVQLTFGLDNYLMDHFDTIYVLRHDYHYGLNSVPFQGHVNREGIYLSWTNFLKAYANYEDGDNVGLHEMAHALSYVNFTANRGFDNGFKHRFRKFSPIGRAYFYRAQHGDTAFLGKYAATNYEEFWAVCVENFFERPQSFNEQLPELYEAMCKLLKQDMLASDILLAQVEAA